MSYSVTTYYKFLPLPKEGLEQIKKDLEGQAKAHDVMGLMLIAAEGINATIAGSEAGIESYKKFLEEKFGELTFKDSASEFMPFKRFKVKIKDEIVQLRRTDIQPTGNEPHLSSQEWDELMADEDAVTIDVRNWYETKIGSFKNAVDPKTWKFSQFPKWVEKSEIPKDKKIGIFCTGGIRCEKAAVAMREQGYENVYQLDGGILKYIEEKPNQNFEGDCFVFDHRVAVDQKLAPSEVNKRCPHCGNSGDQKAQCTLCEKSYHACADCQQKLPAELCSKDCKYKYSCQV